MAILVFKNYELMEAKFDKISTPSANSLRTAPESVSNLYRFAPDLLSKMPDNAWIKFLFIHKKTSLVTLSKHLTPLLLLNKVIIRACGALRARG
jgi:hypothetical protein